MAKRTTRSPADDATMQAGADKAKTRAKARREVGPTAGPETISEQLEDPGRVRQAPGDVVAADAGRDSALEPSEEEIRARAYQMYLERGAGHGLDFEDWLQAERELKQGR